MSETPEKDKYLKWFNDEKAKGLKDIKFAFAPDWYTADGVKAPEGTTTEDLYRELNIINDVLADGDYKVVAEFDGKGKGFF